MGMCLERESIEWNILNYRRKRKWKLDHNERRKGRKKDIRKIPQFGLLKCIKPTESLLDEQPVEMLSGDLMLN